MLVLDVNLQHGDSRGIATRLRTVLPARHDLGRGRQGVADEDRALQHQAAIEEIATDALRGRGGLADRHVADEVRVGEEARRLPVTAWQSGSESGRRSRSPKERSVKRSMAGRKGDGRGVVEDRADREVLEVRTVDRDGLAACDSASDMGSFILGVSVYRPARLLTAALVRHAESSTPARRARSSRRCWSCSTGASTIFPSRANTPLPRLLRRRSEASTMRPCPSDLLGTSA